MILLAVDIGGTNYSAALIRDDGKILTKLHRQTKASGGRRWMLKQVVAACNELLEYTPEQPAACGIGFGGPVDFPNQRIRRSMHVGGWSNFDLACFLRDALALPTVIDNDANTAALGEHAWGAGRGAKSMVYLTVSTGIGGGIVIDGNVYRGAESYAGEFGHMPLLFGAPDCVCTQQGCVEASCSGTAIGKWVREEARKHARDWKDVVREEGGVEKLEARTLFDAARNGRRAARALVDRYAERFGRALVGLLALINPECVVIGGGVSQAGDTLFVPLRRAIRAQMPNYLPKNWRVVPAALGMNSVLCGAAQLALRYNIEKELFAPARNENAAERG